jgi:hypothetical protein
MAALVRTVQESIQPFGEANPLRQKNSKHSCSGMLTCELYCYHTYRDRCLTIKVLFLMRTAVTADLPEVFGTVAVDGTYL